MPESMQITMEPRKGYALLTGGGDIAEITRVLSKDLVRHIHGPVKVPRVRGAAKAFSFHWSNAQGKWDVIMWKDFPWTTDGAEFFLFTSRTALSPTGKGWSLAEMRYVAQKLGDHPGFGSAMEGGRRAAGAKTYTVYLFSQTGKTLFKKDFKARDTKDAEKKGHKIVLPQLDKHDDAEDWVVEPKPTKKAARVLKITQAAAKGLLKRDHWRLDRNDQSYEMRVASFYSIYITEKRHTGTGEHHFMVVWYTGNPSRRWGSQIVGTLKDAVGLANRHKEESDRITAEELGEDPAGKLAGKIPGGKADKHKPSDFDAKELAMGVKIEKEHTDDPALAKEIAMDHLAEFPDYYTRLKKMEQEAEAEGGKTASRVAARYVVRACRS